MTFRSNPLTLTPREQLRLTGQGIIAENYSRANADNSSVMIDGTVYYMAIGLRAGDLISNIFVIVTGAATAAGMTLSKVGLLNSSGVRLGISADLGAAWESQGQKTHALISPVTITSDGLYVVGIVAKCTGTLPSMPRGTGFGNTAQAIGSNVRAQAKQAGQTDIPNPATYANGDSSYWVGVG